MEQELTKEQADLLLKTLRKAVRFFDQEWIVYFVGPHFIPENTQGMLGEPCGFLTPALGYTFNGEQLTLAHIEQLQARAKQALVKIIEGDLAPAEKLIKELGEKLTLRRVFHCFESGDFFMGLEPTRESQKDFGAMVADRFMTFLCSGKWRDLKKCQREGCGNLLVALRTHGAFCCEPCRYAHNNTEKKLRSAQYTELDPSSV